MKRLTLFSMNICHIDVRKVENRGEPGDLRIPKRRLTIVLRLPSQVLYCAQLQFRNLFWALPGLIGVVDFSVVEV